MKDVTFTGLVVRFLRKYNELIGLYFDDERFISLGASVLFAAQVSNIFIFVDIFGQSFYPNDLMAYLPFVAVSFIPWVIFYMKGALSFVFFKTGSTLIKQQFLNSLLFSLCPMIVWGASMLPSDPRGGNFILLYGGFLSLGIVDVQIRKFCDAIKLDKEE